MCGLTGFWNPDGFSALTGQRCVETMVMRLAHRGPDDSGVWVDAKIGIAFAHRRLSILDLSPAGHQPMVSVSGRFVMIFNGEIYNHLALRQELSGVAWKGHSDTETLLVAIAAWGVERALDKCYGMFAFALWDRQEQTLTLARDRLGEKPLYYGWQGGIFLFGSELKALRAHPAFQGEIDRESLTLFLQYNYLPASSSIYKGIRKLLPGTFLVLRGAGAACAKQKIYWSASQLAVQGQRDLFPGDAQEAAEELERLLSRSVTGQMLADVPLGAFLSGGVDSTCVVALMQAQTGRAVKTFTIGFQNSHYNEAEQAKSVARHLGTDHTELYVTSGEAMAVIPRLPELYDEPFADSSQIPTFLVAELARRDVTVALSGDGGDELFGGYNRHLWVPQLWQRYGLIPRPLRAMAARILKALPPHSWDKAFHFFSRRLPETLHQMTPGDKVHKLANILSAGSPEEMYSLLVSVCHKPEEVVIGGGRFSSAWRGDIFQHGVSDFAHRMMYVDLVSYLPDDILVKLDRASMAVSLESRIPFLDHRVVEFAWRLPFSMKIRNGQGKWLLRQVLYKYVPRELIERPKMGFGIPLDSWLRGPLREWANELLAEGRLRREGFLHPEPVRSKWHEHLSGRRNWAHHLWGVLMFEAWLDGVQSDSQNHGHVRV